MLLLNIHKLLYQYIIYILNKICEEKIKNYTISIKILTLFKIKKKKQVIQNWQAQQTNSNHKIKSWFKETFMAMMCMIAVMSVHFFITCKSLRCKSFLECLISTA